MAAFLAPLGALVVLLLAAGHSTLGEIYILRPLSHRELPPFMGARRGMHRTLRVSWHLVSLAWFGFAALIAGEWTMFPRIDPQVIVFATLAATGVVIAYTSRGRHPAWAGFAVAAACAWWV